MATPHLNSPYDRILFVTVHSADGLKNTRMMGTINPYAVVRKFEGAYASTQVKVAGGNAKHSGGRAGQTGVVKNTKSPAWRGETFCFLISPEVSKFAVSVFDDCLGRDTQLGGVTFGLDGRNLYDQTAAMAPKGTLRLTYKVNAAAPGVRYVGGGGAGRGVCVAAPEGGWCVYECCLVWKR